MRWYVSYPILFAGLVLGFDVLFPDHPTRPSSAADLAIQSDRALTPPSVVEATDIEMLPQVSRVAQFSPGLDRFAAATPERSTSVLSYLTYAFSGAEASRPLPPEPMPVQLADWRSTVVRETKSRPLSRVALARDIQRELQRVGCYLGKIDGVWGKGSKRAAMEFFDRLNASLPSQEPDVFLLSLVKSQHASVCGGSCPNGQSLTATGRCLPETVVAQAGRSALPNESGAAWTARVADTSATVRRPPPFGRMSIGGPKPDDIAELSVGWQETTAAQQPDNRLARTAALENGDANAATPSADGYSAATSSFDTDEVPALSVKRAKPRNADRAKSSARSQKSRTTRHVQRLFTHPLGTM